MLSAALPSLEARADLASTVAALQRRYAAVESLSADFTQVYHAPGMEQTESGTVYMKKPGLMRWEYRVPEEKLFVADGRDTYLYTPADRQVLVRRFSLDDLRATPIQLLLGQGDLKRNYDVSWEPAAAGRPDGAIRLRLTPRAGNAGYAYVVMECDGSSFDLRSIVIRDLTGDTSEFLFANLRINARVDSQQFQFRIPKGVEVVRMDEKQEG
jgi:outer membrane lipoprotein carrier protein